jgi:hypothetical protein
MPPGPSPLLGYNTNVRHKGKLYHIQTEDSGVNHPHIITHLFADGGRIVASKKTEYGQHLGSANLQVIVKKLMQEQHKAMFIALRDCVYDEDQVAQKAEPVTGTVSIVEPAVDLDSKPPVELDLDALERAAEARIAESAAARARSKPKPRSSGRYSQTAPVHPARTKRTSEAPATNASIFDGQVLRSKSLDEVILSYLADEKPATKK